MTKMKVSEIYFQVNQLGYWKGESSGASSIFYEGSGQGSGCDYNGEGFSYGSGFGQWEDNPSFFWKNEYAKPMEDTLKEILK